MMRPLRVGIVGCGTAGPALALLLHAQGHEVEILERVKSPQAVGAGIMLQDLGQQVMSRLGLGDELTRRSNPVRRVKATTMQGRLVMDFGYADLPGGVPALGVHRGTLFDLLYGAVQHARIRVRTGVDIAEVRPTTAGMTALTSAGIAAGHYDLVVGADGTRSVVRESAALTRRDRPYPYGALWAVVEDPDHLSGDTLYQRYDGTRRNLGVLPTGVGQASIFWSVPTRNIEAALDAGTQQWLREALPFAGAHEPLVQRVDRLLPSRYVDVVCTWAVRTHEELGVALVGDAAHAMSPQLGTGASLALADVWTLAQCLAREDVLTLALTAYAAERKAHIRWYSWLSRLMVPAFQSDFDMLAWPRDRLMARVTRLPLIQRQAISTLMGKQVSPWGSWTLP